MIQTPWLLCLILPTWKWFPFFFFFLPLSYYFCVFHLQSILHFVDSDSWADKNKSYVCYFVSSPSVNLFYWVVDFGPEWQAALHYFSCVITLHTNSLLCSFLGSFLAKSLIINFLSEIIHCPMAFGKWQQIVLCMTTAWKCICKQLDFLVWHVTGYNNTIFLSETQCWINFSQEQRNNTRLEQMQKHIW